MTTKIIQEKLTLIQEHLKSGNPGKALCLLGEEVHQPELENARGVCLLRLNKIDMAFEIFKKIVFQNNICVPTTTPSLYKANYLTAMLLKGNVSVAMDMTGMLNDDTHPYVAELKQAMRNWKRARPWYQRILNIYQNNPLTLPFELGGI